MKRATFEEYQRAKEKTLYGKEYQVYTDLKDNVISKTYACYDGSAFYERTENGKTEFWSTDHSESRIYVEGERNTTGQLTPDEQLAVLIGSLNAVLNAYQETKGEHLKDKAIGFIVLAEGLKIINQETMLEIFESIKTW